MPFYLPLMIAFFFPTLSCCAQNTLPQSFSFKLNGKLHDRDTGILVLWYPDTTGNYIRDTTKVKDGSFQFSGFVREPSYAHIIGQPKSTNYASFFLEASNQFIELRQDNFINIKMSGSATQNQAALLKKTIDSLKLNSENISKDSIQSVVVNFISAHPYSYVSATELLSIVNGLSPDDAEQLYRGLSKEIQNSRTGLLCYAEIKNKKKALPGRIAPEFKTMDNRKRALSLEEFKGRYVLLDFWASWCIPCRSSAPAIRNLYSKYHKKGLEIIAIADDDKNEKAWLKAIKEDKTKKWHHVLNGTVKLKDGSFITTNSINEKYGVEILPTKILIDKKNIIIGVYKGLEEEKELHELIEELFDRNKNH